MARPSSRRPKLPYVFLRGDTFQYRRRIPKGAEERFGGKKEFVRTLGASTWKEAERELASVIQEFERLLRPPPPTPLAALTDQVLDQDLANRLARSSLVQMRTINAAAIDAFPSEQAPTAAVDHRRWALDIRKKLRKEEVSAGLLLQAQGAIKNAGIDDSTDPTFRHRVALALGEARAEYAQQLAYELEGEPGRIGNEKMFGDAAYAADQAVQKKVTVKQAAERFLSNPMKEIAASTLQQYKPRMAVLEEALGRNRAITSVTRSDCRSVVEDVILRLPANVSKKYRGMPLHAAVEAGEKENTPRIGIKTQRLYVELLKTFFAWAEADELIDASPARKISLPKGRSAEVRSIFSTEQLQLMFNAPLYTGCMNDEAGYARVGMERPRRHRFWIPLIALYTGMRLDEIAMLRRRDIIRVGEVHAFDLVEDASVGRTLKTPGSIRRVPIHPMLIAIGLLEYATSIPAEGWLFPDLARTSKSPGDTMSKWFGRFLKSLDLDDPKLVFHSFRHTFATGCRDCGIPREQMEAIGGWKYHGTSGVYGKQSLSALAKALSALEYQGLNLAHLEVGNEHPSLRTDRVSQ